MIPKGTEDGRWSSYPKWPPDMFAVTAYLVDLSGIYSRIRPDAVDNRLGGRENIRWLRTIGAAWKYGLFYISSERAAQVIERERFSQGIDRKHVLSVSEEELQERWRTLAQERAPLVAFGESTPHAEWPVWWRTALELMIIADEASAGVGFKPGEDSTAWVQTFCWAENMITPRSRIRRSGEVAYSTEVPHTLCMQVSPDLVCVLPCA